MAAKKKAKAKAPKKTRVAKGKSTRVCAVKRPCKASAKDPKYLGSLGQRRALALAKYRAKKAGKSVKGARPKRLSAAEKVALGRKTLAAQRKWQKKK